MFEPMCENRVRTWSAAAQVSYFFDYVLPFSGLVATLAIYLILGPRDARLKHNALASLNLQISDLILVIASIPVLFVLLLGGILMGDIQNHPGLGAGLIYFSFGLYFAAFVLNVVYRSVACVRASRLVMRGELASYRYAFRIVREAPEGVVAP